MVLLAVFSACARVYSTSAEPATYAGCWRVGNGVRVAEGENGVRVGEGENGVGVGEGENENFILLVNLSA